MPPAKVAKSKEAKERVEVVRQMILLRYTKAEIKRSMAAKYGIKHRMVSHFIRRAQNVLLAESGQDKSTHVAEAYGFYLLIAHDETASHKDRLRAQERIDKLLGLESPAKYAQTDSQGNDITQDDAGDMLADLVKRMQRRQAYAPESN